jgi:ParB-like chromosome segregation protein Spo0J
MTTTEKQHTMSAPMMRSLERVMPWGLNPRHNDAEGMADLMASLAECQQDAIHVWEKPEGDLLLKGHRRVCAMRKMGWESCLQVVHHFDDEAEAYRFLLQDHGHTVALNAEEKIVAIEHGVSLGMTIEELAQPLRVSQERAQLWFDLGEALPMVARSALADGRLSVHVAELLLRVETDAERREATQQLLCDNVTGEPMGFSQAQTYIQSKFVLPTKWQKEWLETSAKLKKKKLPVVEGFQYVDWHERANYVQGDTGQPYPEYEFGDGYDTKAGKLWMDMAKEHGVPVYVVPAPRHADGYVLLVSTKMLRDARATKVDAPADGDDRTAFLDAQEGTAADEGWGDEETMGQSDKETGGDTAENEAAQAMLKSRQRVFLGAIFESLVETPTKVMTSGPWEPLLPWLVSVVAGTEVLHHWLGIGSAEQLQEWLERDKRQRAPLRLALMLLLCAEADGSAMPCATMAAVADALELDVQALEARAAEGGEA